MIAPTHDSASPTSTTNSISEDGLSAAAVHGAWRRVQEQLLAQRTPRGHWIGSLSTSALSTATAISALALVRKHQTQAYAGRREEIDDAIAVACRWLLSEQNRDGGFGDTNLSLSNI